MNDPAVQSTSVSKARPALRLIKTNDLSRDEWLSVRKQGIGSSDAAAAVGLNPYQSALELWLVKTGRDSNLPQVDPQDDTTPMYWGTMLEHIVAAHYVKRTGRRVRRINAVLQHPDHDKRWMLANIDREVIGDPEVSILECKTAGINGARLWRDGVPEYVQLQVQHQLGVTGKAAADVAVLICGQDLEIHRIERDEGLIAHLIDLERQFWQYVVDDQPPPADGSDSADQALRAMFPSGSAPACDFTQDTTLSATFSDLVAIREVIARNEATEAQLKQRIQQSMGDASQALFESGDVTWRRSKDRHDVDLEALLKVHPELREQFPCIKAGSRRFLVHDKRSE
jgi:putative phage-type endonuclease